MAFPTVESTATSQVNTSGTSHSATLPSGIAVGDLLIVICGCTSISAMSGWTFALSTSSISVAYRVADGSEGSSVSFTTTGATRSAHNAYRISGYTGTPEAQTPAASYNVPSLTPTWGSDDTLWIAAVRVQASDYTINGAPTNYGSLIEVGNPSSSATSRYRTGSATRQLAASSDDPDSFTVSGGSAATPSSTLISVRGVAGGGSTFRGLCLLGVGT